MSTDRMPPIAPEDWTADQRAQALAMMAGPRKAVVAPFVPLLRSPQLAGHVQQLGAYLRYHSAMGQRLTELAILVTAQHYAQGVEWAIHAPIAEREGVAAATISAIANGQQPAELPDDERWVFDYCRALLLNKGTVDDVLWDGTVARFGEPAVMDLTATVGYYSLLALVMNAARTHL
jgi:4-carboxymuconolactone decarboxylase